MEWISKLKEYKRLLGKLVANDLKSRYSGSVFGIVWAFVQPLVTILVFWYVFQKGFRNPPVDDVEYILWFIAGYIPWTYFNDGVISSTNVLYEYSYLVKKMKFPVWLLPIIKVFSSLYIHIFFVVFVVGMYFLYGYTPNIAWISIIYYSFCLTVMLIGISYFMSSLAVFIKDAQQMVNVILQIGFWLTPIFWSDSSMNAGILKILKFNPLYYIISGYRRALISAEGFWTWSASMTVYFWFVNIVLVAVGIGVYRKLKVHFSDLL